MTTAVLLLALFVGCSQPTEPRAAVAVPVEEPAEEAAPVVEPEPVAEEPEPVEEDEPAWVPVQGTIYAMTVTDEIYREWECVDADHYSARLAIAHDAVAQWNRREFEGYPFYVLEGGPP